MSKVHHEGTLEVQSPPSILLTTKLIGCACAAKAGCFTSFQRCSSLWSAAMIGKQTSIAFEPAPA